MMSRSFGCRVSNEYAWRGLRLLLMENELVRVAVLLDKGADIVEFRYKPRDVDFLWHSPTPLVWGRADRETVGLGEGPFADYYEGCWQEVLPNAGRWCDWRGAQFGLHGEVWALPWGCRIVEDAPHAVEVQLTVSCRRMPLRLVRRMRLESEKPALFMSEVVANESPVEIAFMWGHHPAYGEPFLGPGCRIYAPRCQVVVDDGVGEQSRFSPGVRFPWPAGPGRDGAVVDISRVAAREACLDEMYYLYDLAEPWYALANEDLGVSLGLCWTGSAFRCLWYWACLGGGFGWPSWGRFYAIALEPMSSYPAILTRAIEAGTELRLGPGASMTERLTVSAAEVGGHVAGVDLDGTFR
ncbi:MAG: aldose 1-epimerase [Armatimonadetes bacterium]|nr:aldose 1-epimerase [Armatimonadota bacterium]